METEKWAHVPGYSGRYSASSLGRISSNISGVVLRPFRQAGRAYVRVNLYTDPPEKKLIQRGVHQFVMLAFHGPPPPGMVINHKDCDPRNNRLSNLEYVTPRQNTLHAVAMGRCDAHPGEKNPMSKLKNDMVMDIKYFIASGFSDKQLAEDYPVSEGAIRLIRVGKTWKHIPMGPWRAGLCPVG